MTGKADRRRPLAVAVALIATIAAALIAPVVIGARFGEKIPGTQLRADSGESVVISTPLVISSAPSITIEKGTVALAGPGEGESRVAALLRALVMGNGADLVLDDARIVVDRGAEPERTATLASEADRATGQLAPVVAALSGFQFRSLAIVNSTIVLRTAQGSMEKFSNVNVEIAPERHDLAAARGRVEYRDQPLDVDIAFSLPAPDAAPAHVQVKASVTGKHASLKFDGRLAPGERGISAPHAALTVPDVRAAAAWLGVNAPSGSGFGIFTAKGDLKLDERMISFENAEFTLDGNAANGALIAKLGPERAAIEGTLAFANFDIAPYAAPQPPFALALATDWLTWIQTPNRASLAFLREADADVRISAGNVTNGSERLGRLAASFSIKDGKAYGELAELELEQGGSGEGQFTADVTGSEPQFTLNAALNDIEVATIAAPHLGATAIEGSADVRVELTGRGASEAEISRSLAGKISVDMPEGGRIGLDLTALPELADVAAPVENWGKAGAGTTAAGRLTARFTAVDGIPTANVLEAVSDDGTIAASGTIDVDASSLDLLLSIATATVAADAAGIGRAAGTYRVRGPWSAPTVSRADPGKAARTVAPAVDPG
jgi:AsmA protein